MHSTFFHLSEIDMRTRDTELNSRWTRYVFIYKQLIEDKVHRHMRDTDRTREGVNRSAWILMHDTATWQRERPKFGVAVPWKIIVPRFSFFRLRLVLQPPMICRETLLSAVWRTSVPHGRTPCFCSLVLGCTSFSIAPSNPVNVAVMLTLQRMLRRCAPGTVAFCR